MKIYMVKYSCQGLNDGVKLFTTLKAAKESAKKTLNWGCYMSTVYVTTQNYNHELNYELVEQFYKTTED